LTVPVWLDAERVVERVAMFRETYFVVSSTTQSPGSEGSILQFTLGDVVVAAPGGIVIGPSTGSGIFESVDDVDALFGLDHDESDLSVDIDDLWVPRSWLPAEAVRGEVYRIDWAPFVRAVGYTDGDLNLRGLLGEEFVGRVSYSGVETESLAGWAQREIDLAREAFNDKPVKLQYMTDEERADG
jgi:hypothetical protein